VEIRLRVGATLAQAIDALRTRAQALQNVPGAQHRLDAYLDWVDETHRQLGNWLLPEQVEKLVETPRYWALQRMDDVSQTQAQVNQLLTREVNARRRAFEELLTELERTQRRWQRSTGLIVVPDTNVLLHHRQEFQDIPWPEAVGCRGDVHLVIPLVVVTELDRNKRSTKAQVRTRARVTLRTLNELLPDPDACIELRASDEHHRKTTLEFLVDPLSHDRLIEADSEIIDRALYVAELSGRPVCVATADTGMRLLAKAHRLQTVLLPDREDQTSAPPVRRG
jgi:rRNA-processing protein FCF1